METNNKRTCLYDSHVALGAQISPFGGFDMPIQYSDIISEHNAVRHNCGIFDVSHMGEVFVSGKDALDFLNSIVPQELSKLYDKTLIFLSSSINENSYSISLYVILSPVVTSIFNITGISLL